MIDRRDPEYWEIMKGRREAIIQDFMDGDSIPVLEARLYGLGYTGERLRIEVAEHVAARDAIPIGKLARRTVDRLARVTALRLASARF